MFVNWRPAFYVVAVLDGSILLLLLLIRRKTNDVVVSMRRDRLKADDIRRLWRTIVGAFLSYGIETSIFTWLLVFLTIEKGQSVLLASYSLTVFFILEATGRPFWGWFADRFGHTHTIRICAAAGGIFLFLAISGSSWIASLILMASTGFFIGGVLPNIITVACSSLQVGCKWGSVGNCELGRRLRQHLVPIHIRVHSIFQ